MIEEAEKRIIADWRELNLFHFQMKHRVPFSAPEGLDGLRALENYVRRRRQTAEYVEVHTPSFMIVRCSRLPATGHLRRQYVQAPCSRERKR